MWGNEQTYMAAATIFNFNNDPKVESYMVGSIKCLAQVDCIKVSSNQKGNFTRYLLLFFFYLLVLFFTLALDEDHLFLVSHFVFILLFCSVLGFESCLLDDDPPGTDIEIYEAQSLYRGEYCLNCSPQAVDLRLVYRKDFLKRTQTKKDLRLNTSVQVGRITNVQ
jgi:hypothetical protein